MNSVLVAQSITTPQMVIAVAAVPLHVYTNRLFIYHLGYGYLGAAVAMSLSSLYVCVLTSTWISLAGMGPRVWGTCSTWLIIWVRGARHAPPPPDCARMAEHLPARTGWVHARPRACSAPRNGDDRRCGK